MRRAFAAALLLAALPAASAPAARLTPLGCLQEPGAGRGCVPATGLEGAAAAAVSPDGRHVYVAGNVEERGTLTVFARDGAGRLAPAGCLAETARDGCARAESLYGANDVAIARDGATVYVLGVLPGSVGVFRRDRASGALTEIQCLGEGYRSETCPRVPFENAWKFILTPDGRGLIVLGSHITRLTVGPDGRLSDPVDDRISGVRNPAAIAMGPSARRVYTAGGTTDRGKVSVLRRDPATGRLTVAGCAGDGSTTGRPCSVGRGVRGPADLAVSPDGRAVYLAASSFSSARPADPFAFAGVQHSSAISVFSPTRVAQRACSLFTGRPRHRRGCDRAPRERHPGFWGAAAVAVAPDGRHVLAGFEKSRAVALLRRDPRTGRLRVVRGKGGCVRDPGRRSRMPRGCTVAGGIHAPTDLAISPDGRSAYVTARGSLVSLAMR